MAVGDPVREHFSAIGVVASEWAEFEAFVDFCSIQLGNLDALPAVCLTAQIAGIARKLDAYIAIAHLRIDDKSIIKELNKFHSDATQLAERRNRIVHDPWHVGINFAERFEVTARRKLRRVYVSVSTSEVFKCSRHIREARWKFERLHEQIMMRILSSQYTSQQ